MEWWHFIGIAIIIVGGMMLINRKSKAKKPYRTDYKPQMPRKGIVTGKDSEMGKLLNKYRKPLLDKYGEPRNLDYVRPEALLFKLAKEHCKYMVANGKASHDDSDLRVFEMRTNNALATGECTAHGFRNVNSFLSQYINHKDEKGEYTHREEIEGDFNRYGHSLLKNKKNKKFDVLILAKF